MTFRDPGKKICIMLMKGTFIIKCALKHCELTIKEIQCHREYILFCCIRYPGRAVLNTTTLRSVRTHLQHKTCLVSDKCGWVRECSFQHNGLMTYTENATSVLLQAFFVNTLLGVALFPCNLQTLLCQTSFCGNILNNT